MIFSPIRLLLQSMEISKTHLNQDLSEQSQSEPESPLEMTVVINDSNYWTNSAGKRDFKFKVSGLV
jgi:hypothetical protein